MLTLTRLSLTMPSTMRPTPNILTRRWPSRTCGQAAERHQLGSTSEYDGGQQEPGLRRPSQASPLLRCAPHGYMLAHRAQCQQVSASIAVHNPPQIYAHLTAADPRLHLLDRQRQLDVQLVLEERAFSAHKNLVGRRRDVRRVVLSAVSNSRRDGGAGKEATSCAESKQGCVRDIDSERHAAMTRPRGQQS